MYVCMYACMWLFIFVKFYFSSDEMFIYYSTYSMFSCSYCLLKMK